MTAREAYDLAVKSYYEHCLEETLLEIKFAAEQGKLNVNYSYGISVRTSPESPSTA